MYRQLEIEFDYKDLSNEYFKKSLEEFNKLGCKVFDKIKFDKYLEIANMYLNLAKIITLQFVFISNNKTVKFHWNNGKKEIMKIKDARKLIELGEGYYEN